MVLRPVSNIWNNALPEKRKWLKIAKANSSIDSFTASSQPSVSQFLMNKKKIAPGWSKKLKEAEAKFVVGGESETSPEIQNNVFYI